MILTVGIFAWVSSSKFARSGVDVQDAGVTKSWDEIELDFVSGAKLVLDAQFLPLSSLPPLRDVFDQLDKAGDEAVASSFLRGTSSSFLRPPCSL